MKTIKKMKFKMIAALCLIVIALFAVLACNEQASTSPEEDACKDELYCYLGDNDEKELLYDYLLNDRLLVAFEPQTPTDDIVKFIDQTDFFKPIDVSEIFYHPLLYCPGANEANCVLFVKTKNPKSCTQMKNIIRQLENSPIVSFASLTFEGNKFLDIPALTKRYIMSFSSFFHVCIKDADGLSDVYELAQETNTKIICQRSDGFSPFENMFFLSTGENSKGNALQLANYFYETGKFRFATPDMIFKDVNSNK